jgi:hypothetical protein
MDRHPPPSYRLFVIVERLARHASRLAGAIWQGQYFAGAQLAGWTVQHSI